MNVIIFDIDIFKKVVKINVILFDEVINLYIDDVMDIYLMLYIGIKIVEKVLIGIDKRLNDKIFCILGFFILMFVILEFGICIGDSGIMVENK